MLHLYWRQYTLILFRFLFLTYPTWLTKELTLKIKLAESSSADIFFKFGFCLYVFSGNLMKSRPCISFCVRRKQRGKYQSCCQDIPSKDWDSLATVTVQRTQPGPPIRPTLWNLKKCSRFWLVYKLPKPNFFVVNVTCDWLINVGWPRLSSLHCKYVFFGSRNIYTTPTVGQ